MERFSGPRAGRRSGAKKPSNLVPVSLLLLMTLLVPFITAAVIGISADRLEESKNWNAAVTQNTAAAYQKYLRDNQRTGHRDEATKKINALYDAELQKAGENRANASDRRGAEALLNLLESARIRNNPEIQFQVSSGIPELNPDELKKQFAGSFNKLFPDETLALKESGKYYGMNTEPSIDIYIYRPAAPTKSSAESAGANSPAAAPAGQYNFSCTVKVPGKPVYNFNTKLASADEFNRELANRLGVAAPTGGG